MKVVAYSIKPFEKEYLAIANQKRHDITLISNALSLDTAFYAAGKEAVIVVTNDDVSAKVIDKLALFGIKYIITRSTGTDQIDKAAAAQHGIKWSNVPSYSPQAIAEHAVALALALSRHLVEADRDSHQFDFRNDNLIGFNFSGKTVGLVGLGHTGLAVARIYNGMGCKVIAFDPAFPENAPEIGSVTLEQLFAEADVISLHLPLSASSRHLINKTTLYQMKDGVMLINTSRGAIIKTIDAITALEKGKLGYLGLDVYEFEKDLYYEDHENDTYKDPLLQKLMNSKNVLITPHQAYLTKEALQEIADQTIKNLDLCSESPTPLIAEL
ncbi:NAD(P)-dependent oxidoreductase [Mucilaginibacter lappiensis]|uniref:D-lactate dehydrogenase n=1 Tax=Mucilaginibacter lappiensis TaxID=354630 RepID=A0A841JIC7_9SPHI|nr:NAD(P)-dependent oxidoreductase [Mucilaginibacter lappiensis]MBB6130697.1 D-lactate dehydrogenase [Mucilaginibacter lappiensis]